MVNLYKRLVWIGLVSMMLLQGTAALAQKNAPEQNTVMAVQEDFSPQKNKPMKAGSPGFLQRPRTIVFGNFGVSSLLGLDVGGGATVEVPLTRYLVMGSYLASKGLFLEDKMGGLLGVLVVFESGGLVKIRFPINKQVAWYFPFRAGIAGLFSDSKSEFLWTFHAHLIGIEALFNEHVGITFNPIASSYWKKGEFFLAAGIELGAIFTW